MSETDQVIEAAAHDRAERLPIGLLRAQTDQVIDLAAQVQGRQIALKLRLQRASLFLHAPGRVLPQEEAKNTPGPKIESNPNPNAGVAPAFPRGRWT